MDADDRRKPLRDKLIAAAEAAMAEGGLPALRARDLAQQAGCAVGAIYNVFPDLDALILAVNLRTLGLFEAAIARSGGDADAQAAPVAEAAVNDLVRLALAYLAFAQSNGPRWRALFQHRMAGGPVPDWYRAEQGRLFPLHRGAASPALSGPLPTRSARCAPGRCSPAPTASSASAWTRS